jgi:hypothetical protein
VTNDYQMVNEWSVQADPGVVWVALHELRFSDLPMAALLRWTRSLPPHLATRPSAVTVMAEVRGAGFTVLEEDPPHRLEIGRIARFWEPRPDGPVVPDRAAFDAFAEPGYAKGVLRVELHPVDGATRVTTRIQVSTTDERSRRKFGVYWSTVGPGTVRLRTTVLTAVQRRARGLSRV